MKVALIFNLLLLFAVACKEQLPNTGESSDTYQFVTGEWGSCSATSCGTSGTQSRSVICQNSDGNETQESNCSGEKPSLTQECSAPACTGVVVPARTRGETIVNVKDMGALGNGIQNDTLAIQNAINSLPNDGGTVLIPDGIYMIDALKNLKLRSYMHLKLSQNATLKTIPNSADRSYVVNILNVSEVEISGGQILGERDFHKGTTGEWGHGIMVRGSRKVTIRDMMISKNWGDGISIGAVSATSTKPAIFSDDIFIYNVVSTKNRRQGLSIGRSQNVKVYNSEFSYTEGTAPQYGIDIEPDPAVPYYSKYVIIENCSIHHNKGGGIQGYKEVYDVIIRKNDISYNTYGIYLVDTYGGSISENTFAHNKYQGIAFRKGAKTFSVSENIFRNNYTVTKGITNDTNPLTAISGYSSTNSSVTPHLQVSSEASQITVLKNYYAK